MTRLPHCCRPADSGRRFPAQRVCQRSVTAVLARDPRRRRHDLQPGRLPGGRRARGRGQKLPHLLAAGRHVERIGSTATAGMRVDAGNDTGARGETDPATQRQGRRQVRPAGSAPPHGGSDRRRQWVNGGGSGAGGRTGACARGRAAPGDQRRCPAGAGARWSRRRGGDPDHPHVRNRAGCRRNELPSSVKRPSRR